MFNNIPRKIAYKLNLSQFAYWMRVARKLRQVGIDRLYFILSFDCDTPEDAEASVKLDAWLRERNIKATYAVPGEMLEKAPDVYRQIADNGAEFINHGGLPHAQYKDGRYHSITWYHEMSPEEVSADIKRGHEIITRVIGYEPKGFRAPHFGHFQQPHQLKLQYDTLKSLGYTYSTSTIPEAIFHHTPIYHTDGLYEFPVTGTFKNPMRILDSWGNIPDPYHPTVTDVYAQKLIATVKTLSKWRIPCVLNYYVDPAHVVHSASYYKALETLLSLGGVSLDYSDLMQLMENQV